MERETRRLSLASTRRLTVSTVGSSRYCEGLTLSIVFRRDRH
jgi:hypothetical protein